MKMGCRVHISFRHGGSTTANLTSPVVIISNMAEDSACHLMDLAAVSPNGTEWCREEMEKKSSRWIWKRIERRLPPVLWCQCGNVRPGNGDRTQGQLL